LVVGVVAKPPFPLSPAKTGRDIGDEDRASAMFVDAGDRCRPTIAPPPAVGGAQATLRCGRAALRPWEIMHENRKIIDKIIDYCNNRLFSHAYILLKK
jgi:hypothetical protein